MEAAHPLRPLPTVLALAWHLRQRNPPRALALADEIARLLTILDAADAVHSSIASRAQLVRAEVAWMHGQLEFAKACLAQAHAQFAALGDSAGLGDTQWMRAYVAANLGDTRDWMDQAEHPVAAYAASQDALRLQMGMARKVAVYAFVDTARAQALLDTHGLRNPGNCAPAAGVWVDYALGVLAQSSSDLILATQHYERTYAAGLKTGQIRLTALAAGNLSSSLVELNNLTLTLALDWAERGLALAQSAGLPCAPTAVLRWPMAQRLRPPSWPSYAKRNPAGREEPGARTLVGHRPANRPAQPPTAGPGTGVRPGALLAQALPDVHHHAGCGPLQDH